MLKDHIKEILNTTIERTDLVTYKKAGAVG